MYTIYKLIFSNGLLYVGITCRTHRQRFNSHKDRAFKQKSNIPVHVAFREIGMPEIEIIDYRETRLEAEALEKELILTLKTFHPHGYNMQSGGINGYSLNETSGQKISKANKGRNYEGRLTEKRSAASKENWKNPEYREKVAIAVEASKTPELSAIKAQNMKSMWEKRRANGYTGITEEHRAKLSEAAKARKPRTDEQRAACSERMKERWAKKKLANTEPQ